MLDKRNYEPKESSGNKLQLTSPSVYSSLLSASILSITFLNSLKRSGGEFGGRYQVPTRNTELRGRLISTIINQSSTKAVAFLHEQSYASGSNLFENYVKVDLTKSFNPNMTGIYSTFFRFKHERS